jgi:hypothetical protein
MTNLFTDVANDRVGLCAPSCDPLQQNCSSPNTACYIDIVGGAAHCAPTATGASGAVQDTACVADVSGNCLLNGCARGYAPMLPASYASQEMLCSKYCSPVDTYVGVTSGAAGIAPASCSTGEECRHLQTFNSSAGNVSDKVGLCVSKAAWGTCTTCDISSHAKLLQTCYAQNAFGCVSTATLALIPF